MRKVGGMVLGTLAFFSALVPLAASAETSTYVMIGGDPEFVDLPGVAQDGVILLTGDEPGASFAVRKIQSRPEAIYLDATVSVPGRKGVVQVLFEPHSHPMINDSLYPQPRLVPQSYQDLSAGSQAYLAEAEIYLSFSGHQPKTCKAKGQDHFEILEIERDTESDEVVRLAADLTLTCDPHNEERVHVRVRYNSTIDDSAAVALRELAQRVGKDSDLDGVPDRQDLCPDSTSYPTDRLGCTGADDQLYQDLDSDGHRDSFDACLNTPSGEVTDESGCSRAQFCKRIKNKYACIYADFSLDFTTASGAPKDCKWVSTAVGCTIR